MTTTTHLSSSELETRRIAFDVARSLKGGDVVALEGDLGAGKTRFVQGLAEGLGVDPDHVASPTFVLSQEHRASRGLTLVHVDAYRLAGPEALDALGWDEFAGDAKVIVAVEWASRIAAAIPAQAVRVDIEHAGEHSRRITITRPDTAARCPTCGKAFDIALSTAPFCSERCRLADLNRWFRGDYTISRNIEPEEDP